MATYTISDRLQLSPGVGSTSAPTTARFRCLSSSHFSLASLARRCISASISPFLLCPSPPAAASSSVDRTSGPICGYGSREESAGRERLAPFRARRSCARSAAARCARSSSPSCRASFGDSEDGNLRDAGLGSSGLGGVLGLFLVIDAAAVSGPGRGGVMDLGAVCAGATGGRSLVRREDDDDCAA